MKKLKRLFCNHDFVSIGKYYDMAEGDWDFYAGKPYSYLYVWEASKCEKCGKVKHNKLLTKKFLGWNKNREYQTFLRIRFKIRQYDEWLLDH